MWYKILLVMMGGALGAVSRYTVTLVSARLFGTAFPWGTLVVNLTGCLIIGLLFGLAERTEWVSPGMRLFIATGFLGALTTFSTFAYETVAAAGTGSAGVAAANLIVSNAAGLALVFAGMWLARLG